jgi:hypothetical protein
MAFPLQRRGFWWRLERVEELEEVERSSARRRAETAACNLRAS